MFKPQQKPIQSLLSSDCMEVADESFPANRAALVVNLTDKPKRITKFDTVISKMCNIVSRLTALGNSPNSFEVVTRLEDSILEFLLCQQEGAVKRMWATQFHNVKTTAVGRLLTLDVLDTNTPD